MAAVDPCWKSVCFVGYFDCKMEWRTKRFIIKEKNVFDSAYNDHKGIELALQDLAAFHGAEDIVEKKNCL